MGKNHRIKFVGMDVHQQSITIALARQDVIRDQIKILERDLSMAMRVFGL